MLRKSSISETIKQNEKLSIELNIENVGFGNLVNNKIATLILSKDDKIYEIKTNLDATKLNSKEITKIKFDIELPDGIETGNWNVYLRISQYGNIKNDNNYLCIRFANNGDIWNKTLGANYIGKINIQEKENTPARPAAPQWCSAAAAPGKTLRTTSFCVPCHPV